MDGNLFGSGCEVLGYTRDVIDTLIDYGHWDRSLNGLFEGGVRFVVFRRLELGLWASELRWNVYSVASVLFVLIIARVRSLRFRNKDFDAQLSTVIQSTMMLFMQSTLQIHGCR